MIESQKAKIRKGMGPRRDPTCYRVEQDIVIPAGTILRSIGDGKFAAACGLSSQSIEASEFSIKPRPGISPDGSVFRKVVA